MTRNTYDTQSRTDLCMRIDTYLDDSDRKAVQEYADANHLTMKGAYTRLLRDGLFTRTSVGYYPEADTIGIKWHGCESSIRTNVKLDAVVELLKTNPDEQHYLYMPHRFAAKAGYGDLDVEPSFFELRPEQSGDKLVPETLEE